MEQLQAIQRDCVIVRKNKIQVTGHFNTLILQGVIFSMSGKLCVGMYMTKNFHLMLNHFIMGTRRSIKTIIHLIFLKLLIFVKFQQWFIFLPFHGLKCNSESKESVHSQYAVRQNDDHLLFYWLKCWLQAMRVQVRIQAWMSVVC